MIPPLIADMARTHGLPPLKRAVGWMTRLLPIPQPTTFTGAGASARLGQAIGDFHHQRVMVVTDAPVARLGLLEPLLDALDKAGVATTVFDRVTPDAPIALIDEGVAHYQREGCDALVAVGGGSVMDAAKVIGLCVTNGKPPRALVGYFRGLHAPPPLYAVPTTAGTGSEVTVAAVISDPDEGRKYVVADTRIVPRMAALDPLLMQGLPRHITAATGMDALTHAVEAYIGDWGTEHTNRLALAAVRMIYQNLPRACDEGLDLHAREQMALASMYAGQAFTRANVGNVHALAHQLGGRYHTPHGLANAILLPPVLRWCAASVTDRLATLALRAGVATENEPVEQRAQAFVESVDALNQRVGIPRTLAELREVDIPDLARAACREADANYPVPRVMSQPDAEAILREVLPAAAQPPAAASPRKRRARPTPSTQPSAKPARSRKPKPTAPPA